MDREDWIFIAGILLCAAIVILSLRINGYEAGARSVQREAVERGYGEVHCDELGKVAKFRWKEK